MSERTDRAAASLADPFAWRRAESAQCAAEAWARGFRMTDAPCPLRATPSATALGPVRAERSTGAWVTRVAAAAPDEPERDVCLLDLGDHLEALPRGWGDPILRAAYDEGTVELERLPSEVSDAPAISAELTAAFVQLGDTLREHRLVDGVEVEGRRLLLHLVQPALPRWLAAMAPRVGLHLGSLPPRDADTLRLVVTRAHLPANLDFATQRLLSLLEHAAAAPGTEFPRPEPVPPKSRPSATRLRAVSGDELADAERAEILDQIVGLEARVYEPARRDSREKLARALDPGGVAVLAEDAAGNIVGSALFCPLERISGVDGVDDDPRRARPPRAADAGDTVYTLAVTLDPSTRGQGLGFRLKQRATALAGQLRRADGRPRHHYVSGRNRVGHTAAMRRINAKLGAYERFRLEGQYGEADGVATYYRMPVRGLSPAPEVEAKLAAGALREAILSGDLYGVLTSPLALSAELRHGAVERAEAFLRALRPQARVHVIPHGRIAAFLRARFPERRLVAGARGETFGGVATAAARLHGVAGEGDVLVLRGHDEAGRAALGDATAVSLEPEPHVGGWLSGEGGPFLFPEAAMWIWRAGPLLVVHDEAPGEYPAAEVWDGDARALVAAVHLLRDRVRAKSVSSRPETGEV